MNRQGYHLGPSGSSVPKAPPPFTLPSRKREGGASGADGHIAGAGAKWASPSASLSALAAASPGTHPSSQPHARPRPPLQHEHPHGMNVTHGNSRAIMPSSQAHTPVALPNAWSPAPSTRTSQPSVEKDFPSLPAAGAVPADNLVEDDRVAQSRSSVIPESSLSTALSSTVSGSSSSTCANPVSRRLLDEKPPPMRHALPLAEPSDSTHRCQEDTRTEAAPPPPAVGDPPMPPSPTSSAITQPNDTQGSHAPSPVFKAVSPDGPGLDTDSSNVPALLPHQATDAATCSVHEANQMDEMASIPEENNTVHHSSTHSDSALIREVAVDLDMEMVRGQHDVMKRKAEIAAERRKAYELEEKRRREGAEQKLRELEARLASRSVVAASRTSDDASTGTVTTAAGPDSSGPVRVSLDAPSPKVLLRRSHDGNGSQDTSHPPTVGTGKRSSRNAASKISPSEVGERLAALRAAPAPPSPKPSNSRTISRNSQRSRNWRDPQSDVSELDPLSAVTDGESKAGNRNQFIGRRQSRAEARDAVRDIIRLCINRATRSSPNLSTAKQISLNGSSEKAFQKSHGRRDMSFRGQSRASSRTAASRSDGNFEPLGTDHADGVAPRPGPDVNSPPRKNVRKRGGRMERNKRERKEALVVEAATASDVLADLPGREIVGQGANCATGEAVQVSSGLTPSVKTFNNFSTSGPPHSATAPFTQASPSDVDSNPWDTRAAVASPPSFDDISRAFSNHPTKIPLAGAPLVRPANLSSSAPTPELTSPWTTGGLQSTWQGNRSVSNASSTRPCVTSPQISSSSLNAPSAPAWRAEPEKICRVSIPQHDFIAPTTSLGLETWPSVTAEASALHNTGNEITVEWPLTRESSTELWVYTHFGKAAAPADVVPTLEVVKEGALEAVGSSNIRTGPVDSVKGGHVLVNDQLHKRGNSSKLAASQVVPGSIPSRAHDAPDLSRGNLSSKPQYPPSSSQSSKPRGRGMRSRGAARSLVSQGNGRPIFKDMKSELPSGTRAEPLHDRSDAHLTAEHELSDISKVQGDAARVPRSPRRQYARRFPRGRGRGSKVPEGETLSSAKQTPAASNSRWRGNMSSSNADADA